MDVTAGNVASAVIGSIILAAVYLAPTIVAAVRRNNNLVWVALVDILLGWTVLGWIAAWVMCFVSPNQQRAVPWGPQGYTMSGMSPDGLYWWDGTAWRSTAVVAPPHAPRSPDGRWWWDGLNWRPVPGPPPPPGPGGYPPPQAIGAQPVETASQPQPATPATPVQEPAPQQPPPPPSLQPQPPSRPAAGDSEPPPPSPPESA